ncbi:hypothetical protein NEAUS03_0805 [Nematocida ausubeli]|nr:hypothetical protein NEAUS03_0805 [Nematocida ausubeli]
MKESQDKLLEESCENTDALRREPLPQEESETADSVTVYTNKEGERVVRIVNLIQTMECTPEKVETVVSVRTLPTLEKPIDVDAYANLCIFCDHPVDADVSILLCAKCLLLEPPRNTDSCPNYSFI